MATVAPVRLLSFGSRRPPSVTHVPLVPVAGSFEEGSPCVIGLPRQVDDELHAAVAAPLRELLRDDVLRVGGSGILVVDELIRGAGDEPERSRRGLLVALRVAGRGAATVHAHERVFERATEDRVRVLLETRMGIAPVLLTYDDARGAVRDAVRGAFARGTARGEPFEGLSLRELPEDALGPIAEGLAGMGFVVADGHHRLAAARRAYESVRQAAGEATAEPFAYILGYLVEESDPGLVIRPTHRALVGLGELDVAACCAAAAPWITAEPASPDAEPSGADVIVRLPGDRALRLRPAPDAVLASHPRLRDQAEALRAVDLVWLQEILFHEHFGIEPGSARWKAHVRLITGADRPPVTGGDGVAALFLVNAPTPATVRNVAALGLTLPQKSTAYFPKAPTGLTLHLAEVDFDSRSPTTLPIRGHGQD